MNAMHAGSGSARLGRKFYLILILIWFYFGFISFYFDFTWIYFHFPLNEKKIKKKVENNYR